MKELHIRRDFPCSRETRFSAWKEQEKLARWWGPSETGLEVLAYEFATDGMLHYALVPEKGPATYGRFVYQEICSPELLVFVNSFSDRDAGLTRAPFDKNWPLKMLNELTFSEITSGCRMDLTSFPIEANEQEHLVFSENLINMEIGFGATFDRLFEMVSDEQDGRLLAFQK